MILRHAVFKTLQGRGGTQPVKGRQRLRAIRRDHLPLPVKVIVKGLRDLDGAGKAVSRILSCSRSRPLVLVLLVHLFVQNREGYDFRDPRKNNEDTRNTD